MGNVAALFTQDVYHDIQHYLKQLEMDSKNTAITYRKGIEQFFQWKYPDIELIHLQPRHINQLTFTDIQNFKSYLKNDLKRSHSTINNRLNAIQGLFVQLSRLEERYSIDPNKLQVKSLKLTDLEAHGDIEWDEVSKIIEWILKYEKHQADVKATFFHIARMTGIRKDGLLQLTWGDTKRENDLLVIYHSIKGKQHRTPLNQPEVDMLLALKETDDPNEKIFKISDRTIDRTLDRALEGIGIDKGRNISIHSFRRLFAFESYEASGHDIDLIQDALGHSNVQTTVHYIKRKKDLLRHPSLYIGKTLDTSKIEQFTTADWQHIFHQLNRGTQYEILRLMNQNHSK